MVTLTIVRGGKVVREQMRLAEARRIYELVQATRTAFFVYSNGVPVGEAVRVPA